MFHIHLTGFTGMDTFILINPFSFAEFMYL
jgi:hypothetical protein